MGMSASHHREPRAAAARKRPNARGVRRSRVSGRSSPLQSTLSNRSVAALLGSSGKGRPIDAGRRERMEALYDTDLTDVRLHTDGRAAMSAVALGARAFTVGRDIVFGPGVYEPTTAASSLVLAHTRARPCGTAIADERRSAVPLRRGAVRGSCGGTRQSRAAGS